MQFLQLINISKYKIIAWAIFITIFVINFYPTLTNADTRTISLYMINTKQSLKVTYKVNGRYVPAAMRKINYIVRDWRANQVTRMSPKLIDLLWELHRELGSKREIRVISGYRSPKTNAALRRRSKGVAKRSNHMRGLAMDVQFPDVNLRTLREAGLLKRRGGVGYYPRSGIPFVHIDVGNVRHWPNMGAKAYAALLKRGKPYGGYKRKPTKNKPSKGLKSIIIKKKQPRNSTREPIILANVPKPQPRPSIPNFTPSKPISSPTYIKPDTPKLRPSISDPELLTEQILLASIFEDEEDGDILSTEQYTLNDDIKTNLTNKRDLSFYPVRDTPQLEILLAPIAIGLSSNEAYKLMTEKPTPFIGTFRNIPYPNLNTGPFRLNKNST